MRKIKVGQVYSNLIADENFRVVEILDSHIVVRYVTENSTKQIEKEVFLERMKDGIFATLWDDESTAPIQIIHEESFVSRTNQDIPDYLMLKMHEAGESWVRRNTRVWPHNKKLSTTATSVVNEKFPRETIHTIKWFWEDDV